MRRVSIVLVIVAAGLTAGCGSETRPGGNIPGYEDGNGYRVECADGMYSQSGGKQGACSGHGGTKSSPSDGGGFGSGSSGGGF